VQPVSLSAAVLVSAIAAGASFHTDAAGVASPQAPTATRTWIAHLVRPVDALSSPAQGRTVARLTALALWNGGPVGLLVLGADAIRGRTWIRVELPQRPNETTGWIPADATQLRATPWRIRISLGNRTVTLLDAGVAINTSRAVIGAPATPTPTGLFAVSERIRQPDAQAFDGSWVLLLTAFSRTLLHFGGGPGQIAIHGRGDGSLADPLGSAASHGCVRIPNIAVDELARVALEGTPVQITG
jgi:lipoprotein-anchoring transpeptidase ErfK/SrfK